VRKHIATDGRPRYTATYRDARGRKRSAGTFSAKRDADRAWLQAELLLAQGRLGATDLGKLTFAGYVDEICSEPRAGQTSATRVANTTMLSR
jgi:hypothetical protein